MLGPTWKMILVAVLAGSGSLAAADAGAHDRWHKWDRHHPHKHKYKHSRSRDDDRPRRVIVEHEPIFVVPARQPAYLVPMAPAYGPSYGPPMDPTMNFNFSFPR